MRTLLFGRFTLLSLMMISSASYSQVPTSLERPLKGLEAMSPSGKIYADVLPRTTTSAASIAIVDTTTGHLSTNSILKEFPGATAAQVWSVAASAQHVFVASILEYRDTPTSNLKFRYLILTYALDASLKATWDVGPFRCHSLAVTPDEEVFCFGPMQPPGQKENFYALRKYSSDGKLLGKYLTDKDLSGFGHTPEDIVSGG